MRFFSMILLVLLVQAGFGQANLFKAIGDSDAAVLSKSFGNDIEICIGTDVDFYSKSGATKKLTDFFREVGPKGAAFKHKGSNKDKTSEYSVGTMSTQDGKWRVFIYYEGEKITGLHFNRE